MRRARRLAATVVLLLAAGGRAGAADAPAAPPAPASGAPSAFETFRAICLQHRMAPEDSLTAAASQGWMPAPRAMIPVMPKAFAPVGARWRSTRQGMSFLMAGRASQPVAGRPLEMSYCAMAVTETDGAFARRVADWAATPPMADKSLGDSSFLFTEEADGHHGAVDLDDAAALRGSFERGDLSLLIILNDHKTVTVMYLTPALGQLALGAGAAGAGEP